MVGQGRLTMSDKCPMTDIDGLDEFHPDTTHNPEEVDDDD